MVITLFIIILVLLLLISGMQPSRTVFSHFELERRSKKGHVAAKKILEREVLLADIISLQHIVSALLLVTTVALSIVGFGWLLGIIISVIISLKYEGVAHFRLLQHQSQKLLELIEPSLLAFAKKTPLLFKLLRTSPLESLDVYRRLDSREELQHLVDESEDVLTPDEKALIVHSLSFPEKLVKSVMTPKSMIQTVKKTEFLGPLVLSELHDAGHSRLPVIGADIDHVVGILYVRDLLSLDTKQSVTAEKAMDAKVYYVREDESLQHVLAAFLRTHHHLFIVVNEYRETVGLITLEDVMEVLIGHKIVDEFDAHDNLRAVALRNPNDNNEPDSHQDL